MAWTDPTERATGFLVTAAVYNADLVDNLKFLHGAPSAGVDRGSGLSIASVTDTDYTFTGTAWDNDSMVNLGSATAPITCPVAGVYTISAWVRWAANVTGRRVISIYIAGTLRAQESDQALTTGDAHHQVVAIQFKAAAADAVKLVVNQSSGGALNIDNAAMAATWISSG